MESNGSEVASRSSIERLKPKNGLFLAQIVVLFAVIIAGLVNLSIGTEDRELWLTLLTSSVGYLLPSPKNK